MCSEPIFLIQVMVPPILVWWGEGCFHMTLKHVRQTRSTKIMVTLLTSHIFICWQAQPLRLCSENSNWLQLQSVLLLCLKKLFVEHIYIKCEVFMWKSLNHGRQQRQQTDLLVLFGCLHTHPEGLVALVPRGTGQAVESWVGVDASRWAMEFEARIWHQVTLGTEVEKNTGGSLRDSVNSVFSSLLEEQSTKSCKVSDCTALSINQ